MGIVSLPEWGIREEGNFEPIVNKELFEKVQEILIGKRAIVAAHMRNNPDFPLRVFTYCGKCNVPLTGSFSLVEVFTWI